ncbi:hypothetical protein [Microcoleus sp. bin38.metabat.b11b12b14.051]|uniref:hypothetical protein n=1 Tax=Microcoleus sp. bin38.metabat.b11b12b14.051 TaxID=2742709 RepID=UPI0025D3BCB3|nr:hypothetical protein [Microcoleus sp. bin38.metabat.b11b12b14.051]
MSISNTNSRKGSAADFVADVTDITDVTDLIVQPKVGFLGFISISSVCARTPTQETGFFSEYGGYTGCFGKNPVSCHLCVNPQEFD